MSEASERKRAGASWMAIATALLCAGVTIAIVSGATVVKQLWFVDEAVKLEAPGRYRVTAAQPSTWTLLQDLEANGTRAPVRVDVRVVDGAVDGAADGAAAVAVTASAASYRYAREGVRGLSAYDLHLPAAGDYEVALSSAAPVTLRLVDDVAGRLVAARRGMIRTAAALAIGLALSLACYALGLLARGRRHRPRVMAPAARVAAPSRSTTKTSPPPRNLQVLPALPTAIALERYGLPAPRKAASARASSPRVPSVA